MLSSFLKEDACKHKMKKKKKLKSFGCAEELFPLFNNFYFHNLFVLFFKNKVCVKWKVSRVLLRGGISDLG